MKRFCFQVMIMSVLCIGWLCSTFAAAAEPESAGENVSIDHDDPEANEEEKSVEEQVNEILAGMSTEQKLAQMMIVTLRSDMSGTKCVTELDPSYVELLEKYDFGGVILFAGNIVDTEQTVTLIRDCQTAAMNSAQGIPMLICVDQEGGRVNRVSFGTAGSGCMSLAATGDLSLTEECADMLGEEISALGFNMDFAPVADVNSNPNNPIIGTRSFSDDPDKVADHVTAFLNGLHKNGICTSLKHFPGHGNVGEDSHTHLPSSEYTMDELMACDLIPFMKGIEAGTDMIMTAHIQYPNIETDTYISKEDGEEVCLPATLSRTIMTGLLREKLGYDGIIITDAMGMAAIAAHFDETDAAVMAINAGVDILLCPKELYRDDEIDTFPDMDAYMEKLLARVDSGEIREEDLDDSVARILKMKIEKGIMTETLSETKEDQLKRAEAVVGSAGHHEREWEIARLGLTLLKNEEGILPLDGNNGRKTLILVSDEARMDTVRYALGRLEKEGLADPSCVSVICYSELEPDDEILQEALQSADQILILSQSIMQSKLVCSVIDQVHQEKEGRVALLSLNLPYDAACYEDADAVLCAFNPFGSAHDAEGNGPFNLNVAAALCAAFGGSVPQGTLPVNVPKLKEARDDATVFSDEVLYERGFGLQDWGQGVS